MKISIYQNIKKISKLLLGKFLLISYSYKFLSSYTQLFLLKKLIIHYKTEEQFIFDKINLNYDKILLGIKFKARKERIKVLFFVISESIWQYDELYKIMQGSKYWEPIIYIVPNSTYMTDIDVEVKKTYNYFKNKNYQVVSYNEKKYINQLNLINPDFVFFTIPYENIFNGKQIKEFSISYWHKKALTCYVPYAFVTADLYDNNYNLTFQNIMWKCFYETEIHKKIAQIYSDNKGQNVIVTGYPGLERFFKAYKKKAQQRKKIIIWSPHHSIETFENRKFNDNLQYSDFLLYYDVFFELLKKYESEIYIIFKPHPALKAKLYQHKEWGKIKTDNYYSKWGNSINGTLNESNYVDLFLNSDGMINSSGSFTVEYLCLNKPCLFNFRNKNTQNDFNVFGMLALSSWYKGYQTEDIINFIENILKGIDPLKDEREKFINKYLKNTEPNDNVSEKIMKHLCQEIGVNE